MRPSRTDVQVIATKLQGTPYTTYTAYYGGKVIRSQLGPIGQEDLAAAVDAARGPRVDRPYEAPLFNNAKPRGRRGRPRKGERKQGPDLPEEDYE